jgi:peptidoglycan/LPS O-acetylase OafA/YrhL
MIKPSYLKPLDGLRGIVAIFIVLYHWPMQYLSTSVGGELLQWFYVMSGYLICRILVFDKANHPTFGSYIGRFYYRRSFRIFPLYLAYVFIGIALYFASFGFPFLKQFAGEVGQNWGYLFTYTYNYMGLGNFLMDRDYNSSFFFGHMWSLSLEEQFYIVIPFLVYFLSIRQLKIVMIAAIFLGPALRAVFFNLLSTWNPDDIHWAAVTTFRMGHTQIDSFGWGCLLAITGFKWIKRPFRAFVLFLAFMAVVYIFNRWLVTMQGSSFAEIGANRRLEVWFFHNYQHLYVISMINFAPTLIILAFERGFDIPWLFRNKFLSYLGKISYGVYVYHVPVLYLWLVSYHKFMPFRPDVNSPFLHHFGFELIAFVVYWVLLVGVSHLSFVHFEVYFLHWKERLDARKYAHLREKNDGQQQKG